MRSVIVLTMFVAGLALAADDGYEEERELALDSRGIDMLNIDNGAGSMEITGVSGASEITVTATVLVPGRNDDKARKKIEDDLVLILEKKSDVAVLKAYFEEGGLLSFGDNASVSLVVNMPEGMHLEVDDGSGSIKISNVRGDVMLDDGSGSIDMVDVGGEVEIEDGSGSISVRTVGGDISINDGSGSIKVRGVAGTVTVDDGSGSIDVSDVEEDLIIVDDGSGGLDFSNIAGRVETDS
jgi:hypothetical protein